MERQAVEIERERIKRRGLEIEFTIPIFDFGAAGVRNAQETYMAAANRLAERAVNVRSEAREAYLRYRGNYDLARHYQGRVLPLAEDHPGRGAASVQRHARRRDAAHHRRARPHPQQRRRHQRPPRLLDRRDRPQGRPGGRRGRAVAAKAAAEASDCRRRRAVAADI